MEYTYDDVAGMIDHSLLQPTLTDSELDDGCRLAVRYSTASVCIKPYYVERAANLLRGSNVAVGTTVGFPHGGHSSAVKLFEAERAVADGATELDMVVNIGWTLSGQWESITREISDVVRVAHSHDAIVKVIFENCYLKDEHKLQLCRCCTEAGADFVKTSTGYGSGGATLDDLRLMRSNTPARIGVKAAGGVRDLDTLLSMRAIGVTRIGASKTAEILDECKRRLGDVPWQPRFPPR